MDASEMEKFETEKLFSRIVGQNQAKKQLGFFHNAYQKTRFIPPIMINGSIGSGKTEIARALARGLYEFGEDGKPVMIKRNGGLKPKAKDFHEINCSSLKSLTQFVNGVLLPKVQDKYATLFFDEASEIPNDIQKAFLTIINPTQRQTQYKFGDYTLDFDFTKQTFIFATSEPQNVFHALLSRLERFNLEEYDFDEMKKIIQIKAPQVEFADNVLDDIASVLRGSPRTAAQMAEKIKIYLVDNKRFGRRDWDSLKDTFSIKPLGLNPIEIQILKFLAQDTEGTSLTSLGAKTGLSREALQRNYEIYLLSRSLITVETKGRVITAKGLALLNSILGKKPEEKVVMPTPISKNVLNYQVL